MRARAQFEIYPQMHPAVVDPEVPDNPLPPTPTGEFGWRFRAANGRIVAIAGEGFTRREDAVRSIHDFLEEVYADVEPHPPILDVDA